MTRGSCVEPSMKISVVLRVEAVHPLGMIVCRQRETGPMEGGPQTRRLPVEKGREDTAEEVRRVEREMKWGMLGQTLSSVNGARTRERQGAELKRMSHSTQLIVPLDFVLDWIYLYSICIAGINI